MPKLIEFNVPVFDKDADKYSVETRKGYVVWLQFADGHKDKFVMQLDIRRPTILTHYASGYRLGSFAGLFLSRYLSMPYSYDNSISGSYRKVAQEFLYQLCDRHNSAMIRNKLAVLPRLNTKGLK